jgi:hypothetical protein
VDTVGEGDVLGTVVAIVVAAGVPLGALVAGWSSMGRIGAGAGEFSGAATVITARPIPSTTHPAAIAFGMWDAHEAGSV